jgi:NTE family protein
VVDEFEIGRGVRMASGSGDVQTAIVLQGGGALGAYEFGVLRALYEQRPGFRPVAVTGVSIGAITAAVLGGAKTDPITALDALWRHKLTVTAPTGPIGLPAVVDRSLALLGNPGMYELRAGLFTLPWLQNSFYDTAPLRATLAELIDPEKLNDPDPRVVVGATNVGTGEMAFFDRERPGGLTFEHVAASGSLPPSFPATVIDEQSYWDGGLFSNTPLSPAIDALEAAAGGDREVERELIVVELFPMQAAVPQTLQEVLQRMVQLQYTSRLTLNARFFDKISDVVDLVSRVDAALPAGSDIRDDPTYRRVRAYRKINHLNVVTSSLPDELSNPSDFSRASIEARIRAGYADAVAQGIGSPRAPGLRIGTVAAHEAPVPA